MNLFRGLLSIAKKEFMHIRRDRTTLVFALLTPLMQLMLFGFAVNTDVRHISTIVVDQDRSRESREYVATLQATNYLDGTAQATEPQAALDALRRSSARVAIVIPAGFAARYGTSNPPQLHVYFDGSDSSVANPAKAAFAVPASDSTPAAIARQTVLYNPDNRTSLYTVPGLIAVILQLVTVTLTANSLVRERENGTLDQLLVTPVGSLGLMFGKILPYAMLSSCEFLGVVFLARLIFAVPIVGNFFLLAVLAVLFIVVALAMGLLISTLAENQAQALQFTLLTTLPSILLSGYLAPRETLPGILTVISEFFPVTYFVAITRGILIRGATFTDLWPNVMGLVIVGLVLVTLATLRFRKTLS